MALKIIKIYFLDNISGFTSFPYSLSKDLVQSSYEKASIELVLATMATPSTQPSFGFIQLSIRLIEVSSTLSKKLQAPPLSRSIMDQKGIPTISVISTFFASPSISTIVSIPHIASTMIIN